MEDNFKYENIDKYSQLLKKYLSKEITQEELGDLKKWIASTSINASLLDKISSSSYLLNLLENKEEIDTELEYQKFVKRLPKRVLHNKRKNTLFKVISIAACISICLGISFILFTRYTADNTEQVKFASDMHAILTTADGEVIALSENTNNIKVDNFSLTSSSEKLKYNNTSIDTMECIRHHLLQVPVGAQYDIELPDGSTARLNSLSSIDFPECFTAYNRTVKVTGEVYFEVAKDSLRPFIVQCGEIETEVLGTKFGISYYPDIEQKVILSSGKVKVSHAEKQVILLPGEKVVVEKDQLIVSKVVVENELAWLNGTVVFEHTPLVQVLDLLTRYYGVSFLYEDECMKNLLFTFQFARDKGLDNILDIISKMNVISFEKKGNSLLIKQVLDMDLD